MALIRCPECDREISDKALMCPNCGLVFGGRPFGYEYRSPVTVFGLPLVHIVMGFAFDPMTGRPRIAKGIIAIGPIAVGVVALGGVALGVLSLGGVAAGLLTLGGVSVGLLLAMGGVAVGTVALGGAAIGYYAFGGGVIGVHALGGNARDEQAVRFFRDLLGPWVEQVEQGRRP